MAFTGTATVTSLGKYRARTTGLSLAASAAGTIGLNGDSGAGVQLPSTFPTAVDAGAGSLTLSDLVSVEVVPVSTVVNANKIRVTKGGTPFRITFTNDDASNASPEVEIRVSYAHSATR